MNLTERLLKLKELINTIAAQNELADEVVTKTHRSLHALYDSGKLPTHVVYGDDGDFHFIFKLKEE